MSALAVPTQAPALRLSGVGKAYTNHAAVEAIGSIDLEVSPGELIAVLGPRGCGTSTLLAMIAGLEPATRGRIVSGGRRVRRSGADRALLGKETGLLPWLDARRNVELGLRGRKLPSFERAAVARRCLDAVSMHRFETTTVAALSAEHQHRVALARALAGNPAILLLDDPYADFDPKVRASLHRELLAVWTATRTTIVFATHDPLDAVTLADRVVLLSPRPARVVAELAVDVARPRLAEDPVLHAMARDLTAGLRAAA